jgi:hypothetical protein
MNHMTVSSHQEIRDRLNRRSTVDDAMSIPPAISSPMPTRPEIMRARRANRDAFAGIHNDALHECVTEHGVALVDFKPVLIVDSVVFQDNWGEAR